MKTSLFKMLTLGLLVCGVSQGQVEPSQTSLLHLRLDVTLINTKEGKTLTNHMLRLVNSGEAEVTVLTRNLQRSLSRQGDKPGVVELTFGLTTTFTHKDSTTFIPSLTEHAPVTLRKGETTVIHREDSLFGNPFEKLPAGGTLHVKYEITKAWGERLGIWHGVVSTEPLEINNGLVVPPP